MVIPAVVDDHPASEAVRHGGSPYGVTWLTFDAARLERPQLVLLGEPAHVRGVVLHEVVKAQRFHGVTACARAFSQSNRRWDIRALYPRLYSALHDLHWAATPDGDVRLIAKSVRDF